MRKLLYCATAMAMASSVNVAGAQNRFSVDLRVAGAAPIEKLAGADLSAGLGLGATVALRLQPHLHLYGGWDVLAFQTEQSFAGADRDFVETGYTYGLRFEHPFGAATALLYRLEAGGTFKHVEIENEDGDIIADSDHTVGFELGAGVVLNARQSWRIVPMLRLRSLAPEFAVGAVTTDGTLRYVAVEVGVSRRF